MATRGATQQSSAPYNRRIVLDVIRRRGEVSRKEIIDLVALSPQTVANITQDLEEIGLVVSKRLKGEKVRGQPPMAFALDPRGGDSIGVSLEPRRAYAALVNLVGEVLHRDEVEIDARDQAATLKAVVALVGDLAARSSDAKRLWGVGVALPGPFDVPGFSFTGPTAFEGWTDLSILEELQKATGLPVFYSIDSAAGALGESLFGVARDLSGFFYLHFGVGLGGALIVDRAAYKGAGGNATEIGHIPIVPHGKACYCGNHGCLERYLSLHSLSEFVTGRTDVELSNAEILALLDADDEKLMDWCRQASSHLRNAVCIIENMLDPATIVIGGSAPRALVERLVALAMPLRHSVRGRGGEGTSRITLSDRQEDSSILGAAVLPIHEMLSPSYEVLLQERKGRAEVETFLGARSTGRVTAI
ncbi:ROK family protein [Caulobacter segnis]